MGGLKEMELQERLNAIFCEVFDDEEISIAPETTSNDIDGWDSLTHVNLITSIETRFDIRFTQKEMLKQRNVGDLMADISRKLAERQ
jgi:acyl carrier protein